MLKAEVILLYATTPALLGVGFYAANPILLSFGLFFVAWIVYRWQKGERAISPSNRDD